MRLTHWIMGAAAATIAVSAMSRSAGPSQAAPGPVYLSQGPDWGPAARASFYSMDQGSEIMPLSWARALGTPDGAPFLGDRLARYGYLDNGPGAELPVGFTAGTRGGVAYLGMTCAACHTRQIDVGGTAYRIDGGPALSDFQSFLHDLDAAVGQVLATDAAFQAFADRALGAGATAADRAGLRQQVAAWYRRQHTLFARALPAEPWGVGRLDAVSMILNRVTGLDIGPAPDGVIEPNIMAADAPVRYPFIWDAPKQDRTQWPGFASNGDALLAVARNLGEVYGVFADFHPVKNGSPLGWDYHSRNSADFGGLGRLEGLVRRIGPPAWPWPIDAGRVTRGQLVFQQQCSGCHGISQGALRLVPVSTTWRTQLVDVGTDTREYDVLKRRGDSGVLRGARYDPGHGLAAQDDQFRILSAAVIGSMTDCFVRFCLPIGTLAGPIRLGGAPKPSTVHDELAGAYHADEFRQAAASERHPYEARVLRGIWATAPYLHNGSVASLAELLTKPEDRLAAFPVGPAYDPDAIGLAAAQPGAPHLRQTTGCDDLHSGNSRCGHRYGTGLAADQKRDLLEYLKTL
ncbi:di-heme-cytochrome C peroxidase [uncultured Sphingomonas sp.]|uniref:di-heme-cytochrome C peroxidase n=1 Tax=uncultured Sphingomonas sp. TaxID=158754 RepID=UPI0035CB00F1